MELVDIATPITGNLDSNYKNVFLSIAHCLLQKTATVSTRVSVLLLMGLQGDSSGQKVLLEIFTYWNSSFNVICEVTRWR